MSTPAALIAYRAATGLLAPLAPALLRRRAGRGKEDLARLGERLGRPALARPAGPLVWLHAASVGETTTVLPLIGRLVAEGSAVLLTTVTVTAARLAAERLPAGAVHQFAPVDTPGAVRGFLRHWRPDLALFAEQELWPNLVAAVADQGVPLAIVNGRLSQRTARGWLRWAPDAMRHLLSRFTLVLAQSAGDAERFRLLGAARVETPGNLKLDVPMPAVDAGAAAGLRAGLAGRLAWAAASTQAGDEEIAADAHAAARAAVPGLALLLAPRHPPRADAVEAMLQGRGFRVARRSRGEWPDGTTDCFLLDTIGELGLVYDAAEVVFIGKSMLPPGGGQNPIEPARFGKPVLHGPDMANFAEVSAAIDAAGGGFAVADAAALGSALASLLQDRERRESAGARAKAAVDSLGGGLERTLDTLRPVLPPAR